MNLNYIIYKYSICAVNCLRRECSVELWIFFEPLLWNWSKLESNLKYHCILFFNIIWTCQYFILTLIEHMSKFVHTKMCILNYPLVDKISPFLLEDVLRPNCIHVEYYSSRIRRPTTLLLIVSYYKLSASARYNSIAYMHIAENIHVIIIFFSTLFHSYMHLFQSYLFSFCYKVN